MKLKIVLAFAISLLLVSNIFVGASTIKTEVNLLEEKSKAEKAIFDDIEGYIENLEDEGLKEQLQELLSEITVDGQISTDEVTEIAKEFYNIAKSKIGDPCNSCETQNNLDKITMLNLGVQQGTSTVFEPPYTSDCLKWGDKTEIWDDEAHSCNANSGAVGTFTEAIAGYGVSEAMQRVDFYVGETKEISVNGEILRSGGKSIFGMGAFAGTYKTRSYDDFQKNYKMIEVDPPWDWLEITIKIITLVSLLKYVTIGTLREAIIWLGRVNGAVALLDGFLGMIENNDAEYLNIKFSFTAEPGWHSVWVGLRSQSSGCLTGKANSTSIGQVTNIVIDGIAAPDPPTINGPSSGKIGETAEFSISSSDPNGDKIMYKIDWGDGFSTEWTNYLESGKTLSKSHTYTKEKTCTITVTAEDTDMMQSKTTMTFDAHENRAPDKPSISGPTNGKIDVEYEYSIVATDPDGDGLRYYIIWGDEGSEGEGPGSNPHPSGKEITRHNTWNNVGTQTIKVKATDVDGAESEWGTLQVTMPKAKSLLILTLIKERMPWLFRLINSISSFEYID